jgi:ankyrin repeat protein
MHNNKLSEYLLKNGAFIFNKDIAFRDSSPFFHAIKSKNMTAVELLCDHGADLKIKNCKG